MSTQKANWIGIFRVLIFSTQVIIKKGFLLLLLLSYPQSLLVFTFELAANQPDS